MASVVAKLLRPPPLVLIYGRQPLLTNTSRKVSTPAFFAERQGRLALFVANATGETSESSTSLSVVKSVQNVWEKPEDRIALIGLGFAAVAALWATANLVTAIDKLPVIPSVLELVGTLFSSWFIYKYLLFKPDREELFRSIKKSTSDILGQ